MEAAESKRDNDEQGSGGTRDASVARSAVQFAKQAERLSLQHPDGGDVGNLAVEAQFVTPQDAVIITGDGNRLPAVPLEEASTLNALKEELHDDVRSEATRDSHTGDHPREHSQSPEDGRRIVKLPEEQHGKVLQKSADKPLRKAQPPSHTNPLFPPLPLYGPSSTLRDIQCATFRVTAFFLSLAFLAVIVLGSLFTSIGPFLYRIWLKATFRDPNARRPFYTEERQRRERRQERDRSWKRRRSQDAAHQDKEGQAGDGDGFVPTEGGRDPIVCDVAYYARRVGLDVEEFEVQTEDGFLIDLWHVYDPKEYTRLPDNERRHRGPEIFTGERRQTVQSGQSRKFPVLLVHGLLQSAGAYCTNDDESLAFYLCKSGYDVWLGNNRCGFKPKHVLLKYSDPRMWCWNIRQMGVFDLPALTSRVLYETGFEKIGLVCHSQGTTETFVALAKEQRPELGEKLTVFCALAPAAYAGPLIGKMYFKFMRVITPAMFRLMFGIHAFIPFMMSMHSLLPPGLYGWLGYKVFSFLFGWTDDRWDRGLRDRMFQFAPVYVSAESMRWWLGRECFARHKCILATKEEWRAEEREDVEADQQHERETKELSEAGCSPDGTRDSTPESVAPAGKKGGSDAGREGGNGQGRRRPRGSTAWYNEQAPPFALWVCGNDKLVDGDKLLRRLERGREPHVTVVHQKVIPEYEHLDVIWAMDAVDKVFREMREVLWKTCDARSCCRVPKGCEDVAEWSPPGNSRESLVRDEEQSSSSEDER